MKAVGIIGYKKSGKTTLGVRLAKELAGMGHRVGVVKHASCAIDFAEADTSKYRALCVGGFCHLSRGYRDHLERGKESSRRY